MNAVDTNVLIYAQDPRDANKQRIATQLISNLVDGVLLWQVACEYIAASRKLTPFGLSVADAWKDVAALRQIWTCFLPTWAIYARAEQIMVNYGCASWEALIIAACAECGVHRLYSEDFGNVGIIDDVSIVNPF